MSKNLRITRQRALKGLCLGFFRLNLPRRDGNKFVTKIVNCLQIFLQIFWHVFFIPLEKLG